MKLNTIKNFQCINNRIRGKFFNVRPSKPEEKDILYLTYSPRSQVLKNTNTNTIWLSVDFLSVGSAKISSIKYEVIDDYLNIYIDLDSKNNSGKRNTLSQVICDITDIKKSNLKTVNTFLGKFSYEDNERTIINNLTGSKKTSDTDPFEEFPFLDEINITAEIEEEKDINTKL